MFRGSLPPFWGSLPPKKKRGKDPLLGGNEGESKTYRSILRKGGIFHIPPQCEILRRNKEKNLYVRKKGPYYVINWSHVWDWTWTSAQGFSILCSNHLSYSNICLDKGRYPIKYVYGIEGSRTLDLSYAKRMF